MNALAGVMRGKVVLISGGAEGIGCATGRRIVDEGGSVVLGDIQRDKLDAVASELGDRAISVHLDVRDLAQWEAAVKAAQDRFGKLTHLANIAGISEPGAVPEVGLDSWQRTIDINLNGTFYGCRAAIPAIAASGESGAIVNIGSMLALRVGAEFASYCASKAAVTALTKTIALDCAKKGLPIRANTVHPGAIRTPMFQRYLEALPGTVEEVEAMFAANHPMGRVGEAHEVVNAIVFLLSDQASFTTGLDFTVDGGGSFRS
ncbi:SDR family NAD(P)-dependent oxidoreductase [Blastomonas sp.]|uniref:SDR family NAD(P)-dependent oxidoreductase n=1 Tax=Blastomonas sp. TaxID=1909299 RepID=UPI00359373CE